MSTTLKSQKAPNNLKGIYLSLIGVVMFGFMDIAVAYLARSNYPISEVMFMRSFWAVLLTFAFLAFQGNIRAIKTKRLGRHFLRGISGVVAMGFIFYSYKVNEVGVALALWFSSPIFVTILSIFLLKEKVGLKRWFAIITGFIGVLIIASPGKIDINMVFPVIAALAAALSVIQVKALGKSELSGVVALYFSIFACIGSLIWGLLFETWIFPINFWHAILFILIGVFGGIGQITTVVALSVAETSIIMPFRYLSLIWTTFLAFVFFHEVPEYQVIIGSLLIISAGLFTVYREIILSKRKAKNI